MVLFGMKTCVLPRNQSLKLKARTEFSNILGEYKYHGNPYILDTTLDLVLFGSGGRYWMSSVLC